MSLTLTFTDEHGQTRHVSVNTPRLHIGRSPDNELTIADSNLSRRHALIEMVTDAAYLSDLGSQNGTTVGDRPVSGSVKLDDGDVITLGNAYRLRVSINPTAAATSYNEVQANSPHPGDVASHSNPPASPASSRTSAWLSLPALAAAGIALVVVCAAIILLFSLGGGADVAESTQATNDNDSLAAAIADELADENTTGDVNASTADVSSTSNTTEATPASTLNADSGVVTPPGATVVAATTTMSATADTSTDSTLTPEEQTARAAKRVLSRISTDNTPYISTAGLADVQRQIETYRNSTVLAARLNLMKKSCNEISALARTNNLKPSLVTLASLAQSETGGDPVTTARAMMPKLLTLRATFGTETANSTLLLVAAYPYPFDPRLGSQTRTAHPLASKLMQYGGKGSTVDTAVARSVWFLREQGGISTEAYALVVRLIAIGVIAQDPARYGVAAEPLLC